MEEIVRELLSRLDINLEASELPTDISDLMVTEKTTDLRFVVEVKRNDISQESLIEYLDRVAEIVSDQGMPRLPLVLILINEETQHMKAAIVVESHFGMPIVNREFSFVELTSESWPLFFDTIKSADNTIRVLTDINFRILKRISFNYEGEHHEGTGHLLYLRRFRPDYRMTPREVNSRQQRFELYLNGIPEDDYPSDDIDHMILDAVSNRYQNAVVKSSLLMLNTELRDLRNEIHRKNILEGNIDFIPTSVFPHLITGLVICSLPVVIIKDPIAGRIEPSQHYAIQCTVQNRHEYENLSSVISNTSQNVTSLVI